MAKALRTVAVIAGAVALIATGVGAVAGGSILGASIATIGTVASVVSGVASIGAQLLQKKPPARGSITQVIVSSDPPQACLMGETYAAGALRHDTGYGAALKKVPNPYRGMVIAYSGCGPVEELVELQVDFQPIDSYYTGFLATDSQLGATPEASALVPPLSAPMPGWDASSKLSGQAAVLWNFKFDKDGKRFASGLPVLGAVWKGVKVYDPRQDSTYPGGDGDCRIDDESTWVWDGPPGATIPAGENPGCHGLSYAYGRYQNGVQVFGVGLAAEAIRIADFVSLANVCEANGWRISGAVYEPGDRWANLKDILRSAAAEPVTAGGLLSLRVRQPQVALDTITAADLTGDPVSVTAMQTYRDRLNTVVPKYRSPEHNWELVAGDQVQVSEYLAEDGEEMLEEIDWGLVRDADQATQLAAYRLVDGRELGPITVTCGPRLRAFRPGECLHVDLPELGLDTDAVILNRRIDPATLAVTFTLVGETEAKHAFALGQTGTPPPTPALGQTAEERDAIAASAGGLAGAAHRTTWRSVTFPLSSNDTTITVAAFDTVIDDGRALSLPGETSGALSSGTMHAVFWDLVAEDWLFVAGDADAEMADSTLLFIDRQATSTGGTYDPPADPPDGYDPWGFQ